MKQIILLISIVLLLNACTEYGKPEPVSRRIYADPDKEIYRDRLIVDKYEFTIDRLRYKENDSMPDCAMHKYPHLKYEAVQPVGHRDELDYFAFYYETSDSTHYTNRIIFRDKANKYFDKDWFADYSRYESQLDTFILPESLTSLLKKNVEIKIANKSIKPLDLDNLPDSVETLLAPYLRKIRHGWYFKAPDHEVPGIKFWDKNYSPKKSRLYYTKQRGYYLTNEDLYEQYQWYLCILSVDFDKYQVVFRQGGRDEKTFLRDLEYMIFMANSIKCTDRNYKRDIHIADYYLSKGDTEGLLNYAYKTYDSLLLKKYLDVWAAKSEPISEEEYNGLNKTEKNLYDSLHDFYYMLNNEGYYIEQDFRAVQNEVTVYVNEEFSKQSSGNYIYYEYSPDKFLDSCEVKNLRPAIYDEQRPTIYLNSGFQDAIERFYCGNPDKKYPKDTYENYPRAYFSKNQFIANLSEVECWFGDQQIYTFTKPYFRNVIFDSSFKKAIIHIRTSSWSGNTSFEKDINGDGKWVMIRP